MPEFKGNPEHLEIVKKGPKFLNAWREKNLSEKLELKGANLFKIDLQGANLTDAILPFAELSGANLRGANLTHAILNRAFFIDSNLNGAYLCRASAFHANFFHADLGGANLSKANLHYSDLREAHLIGASFIGSDIGNVNFGEAKLNNANFKNARLTGTIFALTNLSQTKNLETCIHFGPSTIDFQTLAASHPISKEFLRGCGLSDKFIDYLPEFFEQPIQYYSLFISYSTKDEKFAQKLHDDLQNSGIRCWYAPKSMEPGKKQYEQIINAIHLNDRLLLVLSNNSINSPWVRTEINKARQREEKENRNILFPIRLVPVEVIRKWECFDTDLGCDSAQIIREYFIPSFENWKDEKTYQQDLKRLLDALKKESPINNPK